MRIATRGDIVLSYSRQRLRYIGVVTDDAVSAPKPSEFGSKGAYWADEGWMLPVVWRAVPTPLSPKTLWRRLVSLLPSKYSPLDRNGDGAQKAYGGYRRGLTAFNHFGCRDDRGQGGLCCAMCGRLTLGTSQGRA